MTEQHDNTHDISSREPVAETAPLAETELVAEAELVGAVDVIDAPEVLAAPDEPQPTFADFGVHASIVAALAEAGIVHPFPIQAMTLPVALAKHDIIGQAKTGTGKTLGFGIPVLMGVTSPGEDGFDETGSPQALIVVPTRELAVQVAADLERASAQRPTRILTVYGGRAYEPQVEALKRGVEVVVGTPGRLLDLAQQRHLNLSKVKFVVLDEADEMLDLGFLPDVERLFAQVPSRRHTMLFSATMPGAVVALARRYMSQPTHIRASEPDDAGHIVRTITQRVYRAHSLDKIEMLSRILQARGRGLTIVFARTKRTAAKVADELAERGFAAASLHGDLGQGAREQALRAFRNGKVDVLVATDVAARGIDVDDVTHVINYQCPEDEKTYVHRIGRTGRAGKNGIAVTFVDWDDLHRWAMVDKALSIGIPEPVETYSSSENLFAELDIPTEATGRLPRSQRTREGLGAERVEDLGETGKRTSGQSRPAHGKREQPRSEHGKREHGKREHGLGGRDRNAITAGDTAEAEKRSPRNRRRTRGGAGGAASSLNPAAGNPADPANSTGSTRPTPATSSPSTDGASASTEGENSRPRRRRRRGGSSTGASTATPESGTR